MAGAQAGLPVGAVRPAGHRSAADGVVDRRGSTFPGGGGSSRLSARGGRASDRPRAASRTDRCRHPARRGGLALRRRVAACSRRSGRAAQRGGSHLRLGVHRGGGPGPAWADRGPRRAQRCRRGVLRRHPAGCAGPGRVGSAATLRAPRGGRSPPQEPRRAGGRLAGRPRGASRHVPGPLRPAPPASGRPFRRYAGCPAARAASGCRDARSRSGGRGRRRPVDL